MERNYITLKKEERIYIPLPSKNSNLVVTQIDVDLFELREKITCGMLMIDIWFRTTKSGKVVSPIANNYFSYLETLSSMLEYEGYKKKLLERIKEDMEEKRIRNDAILESFRR